MADGDGSKTTKIVLWIIGGVLVLSIVCCVGGWFLIPKEARDMMGESVKMAQQMAVGVQAYDKGFADEFGEDGRWQFGGGGQQALLLLGVGPGTDLDDEATVADLQDRAWKRYADAFGGGGIPLSGIAIGRAGERNAGSESYQGDVSNWTKHVIDVDELVARTGVAAPPASEFFESMEALQKQGGSVSVETDDSDMTIDVDAAEDEAEPMVEETPEQE